MSHRLARELRLLYKCEHNHQLPATPIVRQLVQWEQQRLPDVLPPVPEWLVFEWPESGGVNYEAYWREHDRRLR